MSTEADFVDGQIAACETPPPAPIYLDTTRASAIHSLAAYVNHARLPGGLFFNFKLYLVVIIISAAPLLVCAAIDSLHRNIPILHPSSSHPLPFLWDANTLCMIFISFPCICMLAVTDQRILIESLTFLKSSRIAVMSELDWRAISIKWNDNFQITNLVVQGVGVILGATIAAINLKVYTPASAEFWIADGGHLEPIGYAYAYYIVIFYALAPVYFFRNLAMSLLLRDVASRAELNILPFHPDRSGGLRPVGLLGLRNQYALTVLGINVVLFVVISYWRLPDPQSLSGLILAAFAAYVALGPFVFFGPLLPFRTAMKKHKVKIMTEIAWRIKYELDRIRLQLPSGPITDEDYQILDRLRKYSTVIDKLPVWPFDAITSRKFASAYIFPVAGSVVIAVIKGLIKLISWLIPRIAS